MKYGAAPASVPTMSRWDQGKVYGRPAGRLEYEKDFLLPIIPTAYRPGRGRDVHTRPLLCRLQGWIQACVMRRVADS